MLGRPRKLKNDVLSKKRKKEPEALEEGNATLRLKDAKGFDSIGKEDGADTSSKGIAKVSSPGSDMVLPEIERLLRQAGTSKDGLTKYLRKAASSLESLPQDAEGQDQASGIADCLKSEDILGHKDKDVQICAVRCFCHVLRVYAPDTPYDNTTLLRMFQKFVMVLQRLEDAADPIFQICMSVLDVTVQTKCFLLLLDLAAELEEGASLVMDIFTASLDVINEGNAGHIKDLLADLLASLLSESDHISQELLDLVLSGLLPPKADDNAALKALTAEVIRKAEHKLQPVIQGFLASVIEGKITGTELRDVYHLLIYQIHCISPQTMLPILPRLAAELQLDQDSKRLSALDLIGKLLSQPNSGMESSNFELIEEFAKRAVDQKAEIRQAFLEACPKILPHCSERTQALLLKEVQQRVMDFDENVRSAAVASTCKSALIGQAISKADLENVVSRLRDKKVGVRKETATNLVHLLRESCSSLNLKNMPLDPDKSRMWIAGQLCLTAYKDRALTQWMYDNIFKSGLVSGNLSPEKAAYCWGLFAQILSGQEKSAFLGCLKLQASLRTHLSMFAKHKGSLPEESDGPSTPPHKGTEAGQLQTALAGIARVFTDQSKALEAFKKLRDQKDKHIFRQLEELSLKALDPKAAERLIKELTQRLGSRSVMSETCKSVCLRLHPGLIPRAHIGSMLSLLVSNGPDDDFGLALANFLLDIAGADPHLFADKIEEINELFAQDDQALTRVAAKLLSRVGRDIRSHAQALATDKQEDSNPNAEQNTLESLIPMLKALCRSGQPKTTKHAVRALWSILEEEEALSFFQELVLSIQSSIYIGDADLLAKLEAYSSIGRLAPKLIETEASKMIQMVMTVFLNSDLNLKSFEEAIRAAPAWAKREELAKSELAKGNLTKVLARTFVLDSASMKPSSDMVSTIKEFDSELATELEIDVNEEDSQEAQDRALQHAFGYRRLCAACGLMILGRQHDSTLSVQTYFKLALTMQDTLTPVRAFFAKKLIGLIAHLHTQNGGARKASKYAAVLALGAMDPVEQNLKTAYQALHEYVISRRLLIQRLSSSQGREKHELGLLQGKSASNHSNASMLHERPEFLLAYLVQILAHHPDLPARDELSQESLTESLQPFSLMLQFALQSLLTGQNTSKDSALLSYAMIVKLLRTIKNTEDASPDPLTEHVHLMCDISLVLAKSLIKHVTREEQLTLPKVPGGVPLPQQFFKPVSDRRQDMVIGNASLPRGFVPNLDAQLLTQFSAQAQGKTGSMSRVNAVSLPASLPGSKNKPSAVRLQSAAKTKTPLGTPDDLLGSRTKKALQAKESSTKRGKKRPIEEAGQTMDGMPHKHKKIETGLRHSEKENINPSADMLSPRKHEAKSSNVDQQEHPPSGLMAPSESPGNNSPGNGEAYIDPLQRSQGKKGTRELRDLLASIPASPEKVLIDANIEQAHDTKIAGKTRQNADIQIEPKGKAVAQSNRPNGISGSITDTAMKENLFEDLDLRAPTSQETDFKPKPKRGRGRPRKVR